MKLLPPDIAYHYHALPIATDGNKVTVAMASPDDRTACRVVQSMIEAPICLIRADTNDIDHRLNRLWPEIPARMKFLYWSIPSDGDEVAEFAECFSTLLRADLVKVDCPEEDREHSTTLETAFQQACPDLLIFPAVHPARAMKCLSSCPSIKKASCLTDLLLLPPKPILPIKKVLLVLPDSGTGYETASSWVVRISQPNKIKAIILPVLPQIPLYYGSFLRHDVDALINGKDQLGMRIRSISDMFSTGNIQVSYKIREGDPLDQIRDEIQATNPDLIILPSPPRGGLKKWEAEDLVNVLLKCVTTPVLITKKY